MNDEINQLLSQPDFQKEFSKIKTTDEAMNLFKSKGIDITKEDLFESMKELSDKSLSDNELDSVSGGTTINHPPFVINDKINFLRPQDIIKLIEKNSKGAK